jgi:hypothetical protein
MMTGSSTIRIYVAHTKQDQFSSPPNKISSDNINQRDDAVHKLARCHFRLSMTRDSAYERSDTPSSFDISRNSFNSNVCLCLSQLSYIQAQPLFKGEPS